MTIGLPIVPGQNFFVSNPDSGTDFLGSFVACMK